MLWESSQPIGGLSSKYKVERAQLTLIFLPRSPSRCRSVLSWIRGRKFSGGMKDTDQHRALSRLTRVRVTHLELLTFPKMGQLCLVSIGLGVMLIVDIIVASFHYHHRRQSLHGIGINVSGHGGHCLL